MKPSVTALLMTLASAVSTNTYRIHSALSHEQLEAEPSRNILFLDQDLHPGWERIELLQNGPDGTVSFRHDFTDKYIRCAGKVCDVGEQPAYFALEPVERFPPGAFKMRDPATGLLWTAVDGRVGSWRHLVVIIRCLF
ncbi:hypothetical protein BJX61DRAFT_539431 [Aspergillus egyptiacus]|nr:hypothetical protein BJX61DRAFT_539431 [Aspergillus egyptiacus]